MDTNQLIYELTRALVQHAIARGNGGAVVMCLECGAVARDREPLDHHPYCKVGVAQMYIANWAGTRVAWANAVDAWRQERGV